jgi:putative FmdB family regulatory protein
MPTYDYVCEACGHRLEVRHAIGAQGPSQCPNCHSHALRKAIAAPAIVFKGSGWAKKDRGTSRASRAGANAGRTSGAGDGGGTSGGDGGGTSGGDGESSPSSKTGEPASGSSSGASAAADAD